MNYSIQLQNEAKKTQQTQKMAKQSLDKKFSKTISGDQEFQSRILRKQRSEKIQIDSHKLEIASQNSSANQSEWKASQIRELFKYYDQFGSRWSQIQAYFAKKTQNNIKNKFYGFLKMILRHILKELENVSGQQIKHLSATQLTEIYEGTRKYRKFKDLLRNCMKQIQFEITRKQIKLFVEQNQEKIRELYNQISGIKKVKKDQQRVKEQPPVQNNEENTQNLLNREFSINFNNELTHINPINQYFTTTTINPFLSQQDFMSMFNNHLNQQLFPNMMPGSFNMNQMFYWMNQ